MKSDLFVLRNAFMVKKFNKNLTFKNTQVTSHFVNTITKNRIIHRLLINSDQNERSSQYKREHGKHDESHDDPRVQPLVSH